jgi:hypothetical protein
MECVKTVVNYIETISKYLPENNLDLGFLNSTAKFYNQHIFNTNSKDEYIKDLIKNTVKLEEISNTAYVNDIEHKELAIDILKNLIDNKELQNNLYKFEIGNLEQKIKIIQKNGKVELFAKIKDNSKDKNDINNYRFIANHTKTLKIIDRLYIVKLCKLLGDNFIDKNIFKASLKGNFNNACIITAIENTKNFDNVTLLDILKAFDSVDWNDTRQLLIRAFARKLPLELAISLADEYMVLLVNRQFYYKKNKVIIERGISQGLPSSSFIFTIILQEIVIEWMNNVKFKINIDFKLNIYIDDIYFKLYIQNITHIVFDFIKVITKYKLFINYKKSKADPKLNIQEFNILQSNDKYLGIPFTRNVKEYKENILIEYIENHQLKIDEYSIVVSWKDFYTILNNKTLNIKLINHLRGFLTYKLKPLMCDVYKNDKYDSTNHNLQKFIKDYLM